jgi:hypothetical protein
LSILSLSCWAAGVLLRKSLPIPIASRVFPALFYTNCKVWGLILMSLIQFELILVLGDRHRSSFSFLQTYNHFSQLKRLSFLTLGEMVLVFSPLIMMLAIGLSSKAFIMLRYIPSIHSFLTVFIMKWC